MKILFMCVANSARSQLAEGLARTVLPFAEIRSAGSQPSQLNPFAVAVMKEIGIDISKHYSKDIVELESTFLDELDYVITLCAEEVCPVVVSKAKKLHWPFPDPATKEILADSEQTQMFRITRDAILLKIKEFEQALVR